MKIRDPAQRNQIKNKKQEQLLARYCDVKAPSSVLYVPRPSDPHRDTGGCTVVPPLSGDEADAHDLSTQPVVLEPGLQHLCRETGKPALNLLRDAASVDQSTEAQHWE